MDRKQLIPIFKFLNYSYPQPDRHDHQHVEDIMPTDNKAASFKPFIPTETILPEYTLKSVLTGIVLGLIFSAVTVYLGLRAGLTIAVNIPIAIMAMAIFGGLHRLGLAKKATVLEINTVQTTGAAGESIAAGVIFTLPALLFLGFVLDINRIFIVALAGGMLGVCYLIPLRRYLIEKEHDVLPYPEGVACAEVIKSGATGGAQAAKVFWGALSGFVYKIAMGGLQLWKEVPQYLPRWYRGATFNAEVSPELLGVGYIIGPKTASIMVAGGFVSWVLLIPMITFFGAHLPVTIEAAGKTVETTIGSLSDYSVIWRKYIRYIGAGAVVAGGFINLLRALPTIVNSFRDSLRDLRKTKDTVIRSRISEDLPIVLVFIGVSLAIVLIWFFLTLLINPGHWVGNLISSFLIAIFGFFFATVSSRLVGEIGVSSNPTSGMTIATLMATCLIFVAVGWTGGAYAAVALSIGAVVCICASNAGNVAQSLKTGYLLGCTPRKQEYGYILGAMTSVLVVGFTVLAVNQAYTRSETLTTDFSMPANARFVQTENKGQEQYKVYFDPDSGDKFYVSSDGSSLKREQPGIGSDKLPAPQARLMATVVNGVLTRQLPWTLILMGVALSLAVELCRVRALPFAVGVYLPLSTSTPIFIGGMLRLLVDKLTKKADSPQDESGPGMLYASGLIAGGAIAGLLLAAAAGITTGQDVVTGADVTLAEKLALGKVWLQNTFMQTDGAAMIVFLFLCGILGYAGLSARKKG
jgi:putative OPT family oligopeptide transporter